MMMTIELVENEENSTVSVTDERKSLISAICLELHLKALQLKEEFCLLTTTLRLMAMGDEELNSIAKLCGVK